MLIYMYKYKDQVLGAMEVKSPVSHPEEGEGIRVEGEGGGGVAGGGEGGDRTPNNDPSTLPPPRSLPPPPPPPPPPLSCPSVNRYCANQLRVDSTQLRPLIDNLPCSARADTVGGSNA